MSGGFFALLDDIAVIAKRNAIALSDDIAGQGKLISMSADDIASQAGSATGKATGIVIDDAAVTPKYMTGLDAKRELPVVGKLIIGSLKNKLLILLPGAILLSLFMPWMIPVLLALGGAFLCFEGSHKVTEWIMPHAHDEEHANETEEEKVSGAIRTDMILSAEIMAVSLATIAEYTKSPMEQGIILAIVGIAITLFVYGFVGLLIKLDDIAMFVGQKSNNKLVKQVSYSVVKNMPNVFAVIGVVGTLAMLWVGGGIVMHTAEHFGYHSIEHFVHSMQHGYTGLIGWGIETSVLAVMGLGIGYGVTLVIKFFQGIRNM